MQQESSKRIRIAFSLATLFLAACAGKPVPEGYAGPLAHFRDSAEFLSGSSGNFFYLAKVDGRRIETNLDRTIAATRGAGFSLRYADAERDIPARPCTLILYGLTHYAAPIQELVSKVYEVSGTINFTPEPKGEYEIKGELGETYSAVWVEDRTTHQIVSRKIEIKGSASLGLFEK